MKMKAAINHFGSKTNIAIALGCHKSAVTNWGVKIPKARQFELQIITGGILQADKKDFR